MLFNSEFIESVEDKSDTKINRARVKFKNGHELSIIIGNGTYGSDKGLFEIQPSNKDFFDDEDANGGTVLGYLTANRVRYYINKIGAQESKANTCKGKTARESNEKS